MDWSEKFKSAKYIYMSCFSSAHGIATKDTKNSGTTKKRINSFVICTKSFSCAGILNTKTCSKGAGSVNAQILSSRWTNILG